MVKALDWGFKGCGFEQQRGEPVYGNSFLACRYVWSNWNSSRLHPKIRYSQVAYVPSISNTLGGTCVYTKYKWSFQIYAFAAGSPSRGGDVTVYVWHKPTELARSFLFYSCVCFCLCGLFNRISFHNSPDNSPFSHSVLPIGYFKYISLYKSFLHLWYNP